jgi:hypothetical protein
MVARVSAESGAHRGEKMRFAIDASKIHLFDPDIEETILCSFRQLKAGRWRREDSRSNEGIGLTGALLVIAYTWRVLLTNEVAVAGTPGVRTRVARDLTLWRFRSRAPSWAVVGQGLLSL